MHLMAVLDKKEITLKCDVCVGGWDRPGDIERRYTPYGFMMGTDSPESVMATLSGQATPTDTTMRVLILRHDGRLVDFISRDRLSQSTAIDLPRPRVGFLTYSPDVDGAPAAMLDYLSTLPGFSERTGIHSTMDVVGHLKQFHPIAGVYTTLKIKKVLKELNQRYPTMLDLDLEKRPRLSE